MNKISIIIPCYNEEKTILSVINEIEDFKDCEKEIIIIDDGSRDNTKNLLKELNKEYIKVFTMIATMGRARQYKLELENLRRYNYYSRRRS